MEKVYDINQNLVEVGDLLIIPKNSTLTKSYVLGITNNALIVSCRRNPDKGVKSIAYGSYHSLESHNAKQYLYWHGDLLILEKNCDIPNNLIKFVKK